MNALLRIDTPERVDTPEWIDDPSQPASDFRLSMADIRLTNRLFGSSRIVRLQMAQWLRAGGRNEVTVLDVATGSGDLAQLAVECAGRHGVTARVVGLDLSAPILQSAREQTGSFPSIRLLQGSAFSLPFATGSVDYVLCSMAFHHLGPTGCVNALEEMDRVSRLGWLVNDLRRSRTSAALFTMVASLLRMNRLTRHDGPISIRRAFSLDEYQAFADRARLGAGPPAAVRGAPLFRAVLARTKLDQPD